MFSRVFTIQSFFVCVAFAGCVVASAQQQSFDGQITVTATGSEEQVDDVPAAVTVIDREQMDDAQEASVADMLRRVPGVTVMRSGDEGSVTSVFVRGVESDHTLVLFDGVRLNSPYFGGYDWSQLSTAGLERIEVVRGPYSALWGADAIGGVVNMVPVRAHDGLTASILGEGGEDDWRRLEGSIGWAGGGFDLYGSGFERQGEGAFANSDFDTRQALIDAGYSWSEGNRVAVLVQDVGSDIGIPFVDPLTPTPNRRQTTDQQVIALPLRFRAAERWDIEVLMSRVEQDISLRDPDDPWGFTASDTEADSLQARFASHHDIGQHGLSWGGEWREDAVSDVSSYGTSLDDVTTSVASVFVQDSWRANDRIRVIAGARWDDADEWGSEFSPRFSLGWNVSDAVVLNTSYGKAFRQPSIGELYYPGSGNPELDPERSGSFEVGLSAFVGRSRLQTNLFSTAVDDMIDFDYVSESFANISEAEIRGVEVAWDALVTGTLTSLAQITWLDTEGADGLPLLRRPEWSGSWTLQGRMWGRLRGDVTVIWVGSRDDVDPVTFGRTKLESHTTGDVALAYQILKGLDINLRIQNVADAEYEEIAGYPASGRRVMGGLRWSL